LAYQIWSSVEPIDGLSGGRFEIRVDGHENSTLEHRPLSEMIGFQALTHALKCSDVP
jgi:hypothetical protein